ncbi:hypothetical protein GN316_07235 [Xylophilus sp. Kf1]|nr:hypothetical protein [Xylophilus sp. Kf1]
MKIIFSAAKWVAISIGILVLLFHLLIYWYELGLRSRAQNSAISISTEDQGKYTAKYHYMGERLVYLKLYKTATGELLATRTYDNGDRVRLYWFNDHLIYSPSDTSYFYDGSIRLPPTLIDKLLTYLP